MKARSMKTAPRDGTKILLYVEDGWIEGRYQDETWRHTEAEKWEVHRTSDHGCGCCSCENDLPLAWCPLPKPEEQFNA